MQRFVQLKVEPVLLAYLLFVFAVGNIGSLLTWLLEVRVSPEPDAYRIAQSLATSFVAVAICGWMDVVLDRGMPMHRAYSGWIGVLWLLSLGLLGLCFLDNTRVSLIYAAFGELVAIAIWIISNANSPRMRDDQFNAAFAPQANQHGEGWGDNH